MKIKILFNNEAINRKFSLGWGFACLVDNRILFDTGESTEYLLNNMKKMNIDIGKIELVVISHDHWDHTGGLWEILKMRKELKVYVCPHFSQQSKERVKNLQGELIEAHKFIEVSKDIFVTGEMLGVHGIKYIPEQALAIKTKNGITIITGCAHPGIVRMVQEVKKKFHKEQLYPPTKNSGVGVYLVFGGFHLMHEDKRLVEVIVERFKKMGVKKVGPTHCSGKEAEEIFRERYKNNFIRIAAGQTIEI